jgi:hypothetical protein
MVSLKKNCDRSAQVKIKTRNIVIAIIWLITGSSLMAAIIQWGWDTVEPYTYILNMIMLTGTYGFFAITQKKWNPYQELDIDLYKGLVEKRLSLISEINLLLVKKNDRENIA